jgi:hypothetical protein
MSVANGTIRPTGAMRPPALRARTAVALMCATFAIGLLLGLVVPRLNVPDGGSSAASVSQTSTYFSSQAWLDYRAGERGDQVWSPQAVEQAWLDYRAGERGDLPRP